MNKKVCCFVVSLSQLICDSWVCGSNLNRFAEPDSPLILKVETGLLETISIPAESKSIKSSPYYPANNRKRNRETPVYSKRISTDTVNVDVVRAQEPQYQLIPEMKGIPISHDPAFTLFGRHHQDTDFLGKIYTALTHFTGTTDRNYDQFKGSFSFQFVLNVEKGEKHSQYLYWLMQYRTFIRIKLYQIVPKSDPRREQVFTPPTKELFSKEDIDAFSSLFVTELLNDLDHARHIPQAFVLKAPSHCLVFGYIDGQYFSKGFYNYDTFKSELNKLETRIKDHKIEPTNESHETKQTAFAKKTPEEIAFEEGRKNKTFEIARNLKLMSLTIEQIKTATGLSEEEIEAIK